MRLCVPILALLALAGCAHIDSSSPNPQTKSASSATSDPATDPNYPFSQVGVVYDTVLEAMLPKCFASDLAAEKVHLQPLRDFIAKTLPRKKFIEQMTSQSRSTLERARTDLEFRKTKEFEDAFAVAINVAVPMAQIMIAGRFDVYHRKFAYPDELTKQLFPNATDTEQEEFISWITGEVTPEDFAKDMAEWTAKKQIEPGDRILSFATSNFYWELMAGRQGYLIVRDNKIVDVITTFMN
jgi:hypothetical protein